MLFLHSPPQVHDIVDRPRARLRTELGVSALFCHIFAGAPDAGRACDGERSFEAARARCVPTAACHWARVGQRCLILFAQKFFQSFFDCFISEL